ncbi:MAG TPA: polysaccharide biosynthesis/export family protein, partial [Steroidobacteraceae bacterium]|nr:polysaccharide biosynthesis/export family protein [Steroidobacteraceae bacterium]
MRNLRRFLTAVVLAAITALSSTPLPSQVPANPSDLLQLYQNLTPQQQDAIMKQLGGGAGAGGLSSILSGLGGQGGAEGSGLDKQGILNRRAAAPQPPPPTEGEEPEEQLPGLKASDWVVVQADVQQKASQPPPQPTPAPVIPPPTTTAGGANPAALASLLAASQSPTSSTSSASTGVNTTAPPTTAATAAADSETHRLQALVDLIRSRNPYQLSREGELTLPGFAPIALLGLSDDQATLRLSVEPGLRGLSIHLTRLALRKTGVAGLKPFGYDLFTSAASPSTFAPVANVPVPADYVVGPGDILNVQLYGEQNRAQRVSVDRDGFVGLPELGPIHVAGERFTVVKETIESRFENRRLGVHASVSMGDTR